MITISLCMILKNEADTIGKCLDSVKDVVDEIVLVDTGSTDQTKEVISKYTNKIFDFEWIDDFAAARNYSFSKATKDFILWLDADDIMLPQDAEKLLKLKQNLDENTDIDSVSFIYNYAFDEQGKPTLSFKRERLVKRIQGYQWIGFIHEYINVIGKQTDSDICVTHNRVHGNPDRNLNIYRKKIQEGVKLSVRDQYYFAKELYYHNLLDEAIVEFTKFLTIPSWIEDRLDAIVKLSNCYSSKKMYAKAREILFQSFQATTPRAEALYSIAKTFQDEERYQEAIYWYEVIFLTPKPQTSGFIYEEFWTWRPHLEVCVCYSRLGQNDIAAKHNELAALYKPNHPSIKHNRSFFESLKKVDK